MCPANSDDYPQPFTIGLAIASSPMATLVWIGEKFYGWSDPSCLDVRDLLDTVALYYLSGSLPTSVMMYNQVFHPRYECVLFYKEISPAIFSRNS